jgi:nucleotide-binding universal stress UspA family protein
MKRGMSRMIRMLVATDGSNHAMQAAEFAARMARELQKAEVLLLNVGHVPAYALGGPDTHVDYAALEEGLKQAGQAILARAAEVFAGVDVPVRRVYRHGEPVREIIEAARAAKVDLIVVGSRGLGQIGGLFLGSVSERVLHGAQTPVVVVR